MESCESREVASAGDGNITASEGSSTTRRMTTDHYYTSLHNISLPNIMDGHDGRCKHLSL